MSEEEERRNYLQMIYLGLKKECGKCCFKILEKKKIILKII